MICFWTGRDKRQVPRQVRVRDRFQDRYEFLIDPRASMGLISVPGPLWVYDRFQDRCGFMRGSRISMGS